VWFWTAWAGWLCRQFENRERTQSTEQAADALVTGNATISIMGVGAFLTVGTLLYSGERVERGRKRAVNPKTKKGGAPL